MSNPSANATLTPTQSVSAAGSMSPLTPFADGLLGFGGSGPVSGSRPSLLVPAILIVGFLLLAAVVLRK